MREEKMAEEYTDILRLKNKKIIQRLDEIGNLLSLIEEQTRPFKEEIKRIEEEEYDRKALTEEFTSLASKTGEKRIKSDLWKAYERQGEKRINRLLLIEQGVDDEVIDNATKPAKSSYVVVIKKPKNDGEKTDE